MVFFDSGIPGTDHRPGFSKCVRGHTRRLSEGPLLYFSTQRSVYSPYDRNFNIWDHLLRCPSFKLSHMSLPGQRRAVMWVGAVICRASLFSASYAIQVTILLLCEGVLYAIGGVMLYYPCTYYAS